MFRTIGALASEIVAGLEVEQRDGMERVNAAPRQRVESEEIGGGVEAPAYLRDSGPLTPGGQRSEPPMREARPSQWKMAEPRGNEARPSVRRLGGHGLKLVTNIGLGSVHRRATGFPHPALPNPVFVVIEGGHHATCPSAAASLQR